jgi:protein TonB
VETEGLKRAGRSIAGATFASAMRRMTRAASGVLAPILAVVILVGSSFIGPAHAAPADRGAPPTPPREEKPKPVDEDESDNTRETPEVITKVDPVYPDSARRAGVTGTVVVQVLVGKDGHVEDAKVVRPVPLLDQAALVAAKQWIFRPAVVNNQPVKVWVTIPMRFGAATPERGLAPPAIAGERADLERDLATLHARGPCAPSDSDQDLRGRIIRAARALPKPEGPLEAIEHREAALHALKASHSRDSLLRAVGALAEALDMAPWWAAPYRDIADALEGLGRREEAAVSLELYLVADPKAKDTDAIWKRIERLRFAKTKESVRE